MLEIPVYNTDGKKIDTFPVDEALFGSQVNVDLVKQAVVTYHANRRQGTVKTKGRGEVAYSTKKLFRQKGTGNARRGAKSTNVLRGGGHAFAKVNRDFRKKLPQKMRQAALKSAILAKILGQDICIVQGLQADAPKTKTMSDLLKNLEINRSCLLTLKDRDKNLYLSSRNIPDLTVRVAEELNAYDVATRRKMLVTDEAMRALCGQEGA
ncbi:MAG: 50S ribosomal protein L4 [Phycisphaerae bacterium]|nr:50S ribosomal protein L4 [Phycisphaerae bacterium]